MEGSHCDRTHYGSEKNADFQLQGIRESDNMWVPKEQIVTSSSIIFLEARYWLFFIFPYIPYIIAFAIPKIPKDLYIHVCIHFIGINNHSEKKVFRNVPKNEYPFISYCFCLWLGFCGDSFRSQLVALGNSHNKW